MKIKQGIYILKSNGETALDKDSNNRIKYPIMFILNITLMITQNFIKII